MDEQMRSSAMAQIIALATQLGLQNEISFRPGAGQGDPATRRLTIAKAWQRASAIRRRCFDDGGHLFVDPAWELLLDLYIEQAEHRRVSVTSACIAAQVPPSTALRWLDRLGGLGLVERTQDTVDGRKTFVALSAKAVRSMETALDNAAESDRKLGLARLEAIQ